MKVGANCCELDLPLMRKLYRMINTVWLKPCIPGVDRCPKQKPRTSLERLARVPENTALVGYFPREGIFYCKMQDVDPHITVEYSCITETFTNS